jgi:hypothetical protein
MSRLALALALGLVCGAVPARATELFQRGELRADLSGSLREIAQVGRQTSTDAFELALLQDPRCVFARSFDDCSAFGVVGDEDVFQSLTRIRTRLDVELTSGLRAVVVYDHEVESGELDTFEATLAAGFAQDDFFDAEWTVESHADVEWRHLFYRGYLELESERLDVSIGRQRIAWGVGRLWNPIDRFNAIPPLAIQGDQSRGVDSVDARFSFDGFHSLQAVYAPGPNRDHARYALRYHGVVLDSDVSLLGGVFEEAPTAGADFARNLGDAAIRFEVVYTRPHHEVWKIESSERRRLDDFVQGVASVDYTIDFADGIYVLVEHLYNGNALGFGSGRAGSLLPLFEATDVPPSPLLAGLPGPFPTAGSDALFGSSRVVTNAENQTGVLVGGDITPDLRLDLLSIWDWNGESAAFFPTLTYTGLDALEVTLGVQTFAGPRRSQFGAAETFFYVLADVFF